MILLVAILVGVLVLDSPWSIVVIVVGCILEVGEIAALRRWSKRIDKRTAATTGSEAMIGREAMPEESWSWLRYFSSEGLAVVRLADWIGLPIDADYRHVNELVRRAPTPSFDPHAWQRIV